ncbi:MAG: DNA-directed RNA polymerase subunit omega [Microcoleaceae cyanobacterium]
MGSSELGREDLQRRAEQLISGSMSRYQIAVRVAKRAKRFRLEDFDNPHASEVKPIVRAIVEMSDELAQPELISEELS